MGTRGRVKGRDLLPTTLPFSIDGWLASHALTATGARLFRAMCTGDPVANPHSGPNSVGGRWVSPKMRCTIGYESHTNELRACFLYDWTPPVLGYFDRAVAIGVRVPDRHGRRGRRPYTPDFFVVEACGAFLDEWKTEGELKDHRDGGGTRYTLEGGVWRCRGAEAAAARYGFGYRVRTDAEHAPPLSDNREMLLDYLDPDGFTPEAGLRDRILEVVRARPGITLAELRTALE